MSNIMDIIKGIFKRNREEVDYKEDKELVTSINSSYYNWLIHTNSSKLPKLEAELATAEREKRKYIELISCSEISKADSIEYKFKLEELEPRIDRLQKSIRYSKYFIEAVRDRYYE